MENASNQEIPRKIIQLSDLHFKKNRIQDQKLIINALCEDIRNESDRSGYPDLLLFSGDIAHDADDDGVYDLFYDHVLHPILEASKLYLDAVYMVPGNHDIHRSHVKDNKKEYDDIISELADRDSLNEAYRSGRIHDFAYGRSRAFFEFCNQISDNNFKENPIYCCAHLDKLNLNIGLINSAWAGYGGVDSVNDIGKLLVPEASYLDVTDDKQESYKILMHHHPESWMSDFVTRDLYESLGKNINLQAYGHVHDPRPEVRIGSDHTKIDNQSGALYTYRDDRYLGYTTFRILPTQKSVEVKWRAYYPARRKFDEAVNISENKGLIYYPADSAEIFKSIINQEQIEKIKKWIDDNFKNFFDQKFEAVVIGKSGEKLFTCPPLFESSLVDDKEETSIVESKVDLIELLKGSENIVFSSPPEYGRTTLLQKFCVDVTREVVAVRDNCIIPVLIPFEATKPGKNLILQSIRNNLPQIPDGLTIDTLLKAGMLTICIDDIDVSNEKNMQNLKHFIAEYKSNRFVISLRKSARIPGARINLDLGTDFRRVEISALKRKNVRELIGQFDIQSGDDDKILNRVFRELKSMNVPVTPFNSALVLDIMANDFDFSPINKANLVERFIENLLKKDGDGQIRRADFDFRNQVHFFAFVSEKMCRANLYKLTYVDLYSITNKYLKDFGLSFSVKELIDGAISAKIFEFLEQEDVVRFRFRVFLEFFIARRMEDDSDFYEWVISDDRYLSFYNEIDFYSAINRKNSYLLEIVSSRHALIVDEIFGPEFEKILQDSDQMNFPLSKEETEKYADDLADRLSEAPLSAGERDDLLDAEIPMDAEGRQEVYRPKANDLSSRYILSLLIYSTLVKNTELIQSETKRIHLSAVLKSWSYTIIGAFIAIPSLVKNRKTTVNGIEYEINFPKSYSDEKVAKLISIGLPKELARIIYYTMGTEKLESQISDKQLFDGNEPMLIKFLKDSLYIDLKLKSWWEVPKKFRDEVENDRYFSEVMLSKTTDIHRLGVDNPKIQSALQEQIVDIYSKIYGKDPKDVQRLRNTRKNTLVRSRNIAKLRSKIEH